MNGPSALSSAPMPTKLLLDPSLPIQLADDLLVLWLPRGRERGARAPGLLSSYRLCTNPECLCTTARMVSRAIDDRAERVVRMARSLRLRWRGVSVEEPKPDALAAVDLDFVTGEVRARPGGALPDVIARFFAEPLPYWVLDEIFARWAAMRATIDWRPHALARWQPGELLTRMTAFPEARPDRYLFGEALYQVDLGFSVSPARSSDRESTDALFSVIEIREDGSEGIEVARARLASETMTPEPLAECDREVLAKVFLAWRERQVSPRARLLEHQAAMSERGRELHALAEKARELARALVPRPPPAPRAAPPGARVGRNEPCPCGSGLKYKKCCGR